MLISHSTAYQCFQCGDRRWGGSLIRYFLHHWKSLRYQFAAQAFFLPDFEMQFESNHGCILRCATRWLRNHELVGSATTTSQSFKPTSWLGGFRGGVISPFFFTEESDSFKIQNDASFAELQPFEDPEFVPKVVFPCPCGPWGSQVSDMIDLLYDLFLIWRKPINTDSDSALSSGTCWNTLCFWFVWFFRWFEIACLAWTRLNPSCLKCAIARERCLGGGGSKYPNK